MDGMIDASTTRRPFRPQTRSSASTTNWRTASGVGTAFGSPIRHVPPHGWTQAVPHERTNCSSDASDEQFIRGCFSSPMYSASAGWENTFELFLWLQWVQLVKSCVVRNYVLLCESLPGPSNKVSLAQHSKDEHWERLQKDRLWTEERPVKTRS